MKYEDSDLDPIIERWIDLKNPLSFKLWIILPLIDRCIDDGVPWHIMVAHLEIKHNINVNAVVLKSYLTLYRQYRSLGPILSEKLLAIHAKIEERQKEREAEASKQQYAQEADKLKTSFVYFVYCKRDSLVKIGYSQDPHQRFKAICQGYPADLDLLSFIPGSLEFETELHQKFAHLRRHREWFAAEQELLDFIESLPVESAA